MTQTSSGFLEVPTIKGGRAMAQIPLPKLTSLEDPRAVPAPGQGCLRILTPTDGDKRFLWDSGDLDEITEAKVFFDKCVSEGLVPYRVVPGGGMGEVMPEFDPHAGEILFAPAAQQIYGG